MNYKQVNQPRRDPSPMMVITGFILTVTGAYAGIWILEIPGLILFLISVILYVKRMT